MAKMFYTVEEAADRLGISSDEVMSMADSGKLQQFRDRDKVMFKRDQVEKMVDPSSATGTGMGINLNEDSASIPLGDLTDMSGASTSDTDSFELGKEADETAEEEDAKGKTGISVFDAGEVEAADPMAQTQVTGDMDQDEDLVLEAVGSGSGLLDLTRESDDTSLGAELLDEIYPAGVGDSQDGISSGLSGVMTDDSGLAGEQSVLADVVEDTAIGATAGPSMVADVVDAGPSVVADVVEGGPSVMGDVVDPSQTGSMPGYLAGASAMGGMAAGAPQGQATVVVAASEPYDPVGSGWTGGLLIGVLISLVLAFIVAVTGYVNVLAEITAKFAENLMVYGGGLAVACLILAVIGLFVGKAMDRG